MDKKSSSASFLRDLAILLLLLWAFAQALVIAVSARSNTALYIVMFVAMDVIVMVGFLGKVPLCTVLTGTLVCLWVSYKLYAYYAQGALLSFFDFLFIPFPFAGMLGAWLYQSGMRNIDAENKLLRRQVEELVLIDDVTGFYNLRALYKDMPGMIRYAERHDLPMSLMIVQMRYEMEFRNMLPHRQYLQLCRDFGVFLRDNLRIEDKLYNIDEHGTMAILLSCTAEDSGVVKGRLIKNMRTTDAFSNTLESSATVDMRFACVQYKKEFGNDMLQFKQKVESELIYDV